MMIESIIARLFENTGLGKIDEPIISVPGGFMERNGSKIGSRPVVLDCCGTKGSIVDKGMKIAEKYGFVYVGGHPMAGTQFVSISSQ